MTPAYSNRPRLVLCCHHEDMLRRRGRCRLTKSCYNLCCLRPYLSGTDRYVLCGWNIIKEDQMLQGENLRLAYQDGDATVDAVHDVSMAVADHQFIGILGPSGSGKSSLL